MNKGIAKKATVIAVVSCLVIGSVFAGHKPEPKKRMRNEDFPRDERPMDDTMEPAAAENSIRGDWGVRDAGKAVKVEFDRDGTMEIKWQQNLASETEW